MITGNSQKKQTIVERFIDSGINISPSTLEFILNLDKPLEKVNILIKEASFIPKFNGHLTIQFLKQSQNEEILRALKRISIKLDVISPSKEILTKKKIISVSEFEVFSKKEPFKKEKQEINASVEKSKKIETSIEPKHSKIPDFKKENSLKQNKEKTKKIKPFGSTKSAFGFKPIAKEYSSDCVVLKDPTGKLYTNGDYDDFYALTVDKFNKLYKLMKERGEAKASLNINNIIRNKEKIEISTIGLVKDIRQTKKGNFFITLEDMTGTINVLVRQDDENQDNFKTAERTISDQMLFVEGTYSPGEFGKSGIIFAHYVTKIDIKGGNKPNKSPDPVSIVLLSDTHIGSKEFEEKLWLKFVDFLNGRVGNKNLREIAGKIKYIIINGDLVDGIGIYPSQKDDLLITDIYQQYSRAAELLSAIPDYIKIIYSCGNHDPVRNAIPRPAVPKKYIEPLIGLGVKCIGNPAMVKTHGVSTLAFHGDSMLDLNMLVAGLENDNAVDTMKEMLICRHLAPIFGKRTQLAPTNKDWLVIDKIPDIFHTGHLHINGLGHYKNVILVNSGCFQAQTSFMRSFGIQPTPGIVPIIELDTLKSFELNFTTQL